MGGEHRMEFPHAAERRPVLQNVGHYLALMLRHLRLVGRAVLRFRHHALDAVAPLTPIVLVRGHGQVHDLVVHLLAPRIAHHLFNTAGLGLVQRYRLSQIELRIGGYRVRVEPEHIPVPDAVGDAVAV